MITVDARCGAAVRGNQVHVAFGRRLGAALSGRVGRTSALTARQIAQLALANLVRNYKLVAAHVPPLAHVQQNHVYEQTEPEQTDDNVERRVQMRRQILGLGSDQIFTATRRFHPWLIINKSGHVFLESDADHIDRLDHGRGARFNLVIRG